MTEAEIKARILKTVTEYGRAYGACPMRVLSARFSRATSAIGGVSVLIDDLKAEGKIFVYIRRSGQKLVSIEDIGIDDAKKI